MVLAVLALVAAVPLLWVAVDELAGHREARQIPLQLAGGREAACRVIQPDAAGCPVPEAAVARYRSAVQGDGWLVVGYVLAGLGVFGLCARFLYGSGARRVARWCLRGVLLAGAADARSRSRRRWPCSSSPWSAPCCRCSSSSVARAASSATENGRAGS
jgi:hypothetical protein